MKITVDGHAYEVQISGNQIMVAGQAFPFERISGGAAPLVKVGSRPYRVVVPEDPAQSFAAVVDGHTYRVEMAGALRAGRRPTPAAAPSRAAAPGAIAAEMAGTIKQVRVTAGQAVAAGDVVAILEAMKMENQITAPESGIVEKVNVAPGDRVTVGDVLIVIKGP